jgi:hypothetical protein
MDRLYATSNHSYAPLSEPLINRLEMAARTRGAGGDGDTSKNHGQTKQAHGI